MNDNNPKQQIVDRIKNATNILVTVSSNPSVDELSAAIGLTLMLNKLDKHATAVFSGVVPPAITFLEPDKTLENTVDSLRDFIIALDREKADRLRYRVEDDVVRIFITPYRTRITEEDLDFTHGDFNVELVLALGVENKDMLDAAIAAHGRILHDATVATIEAGDKKSTLGTIEWQDQSASSLCEMLVAISESLKADEPLLDEQISTSLLTGIVSATNRFSNDHTSPKAMTMAAQLMAAGANQQLIASKLEETEDITPPNEEKIEKDGSKKLSEDSVEKVRNAPSKSSDAQKDADKDLGEMKVDHGKDEKAQPEEQDAQELPQVKSASIEEHDKQNKTLAGEEALDEALMKLGAVSAPESAGNLEKELETASQEHSRDLLPTVDSPDKTIDTNAQQEPSLGGSFSATIEEAAEAKRKEQDSGRNKLIMNHDAPVQVPDSHSSEQDVSTKGVTIQPPAIDTLADIEAKVKNSPEPQASLPPIEPVHADNARQEINSLFDSGNVSSVPLPPPPPLPDFSTLPPVPGTDTTNTLTPTTPTAEVPTLPPLPEPAAPPQPSVGPDQFKIPGQS